MLKRRITALALSFTMLCAAAPVFSHGTCSAKDAPPPEKIPQHLELGITTEEFMDTNGETDLLHSTLSTIQLTEQSPAFTNIGKALQKFSAERTANFKAYRKKLKNGAEAEYQFRKDTDPTFFHPFAAKNKLYVQRADSEVTSFLNYLFHFEGGVHGMYGIVGENYDTASGRKLTLSDIFINKNMLAEAVKTQMKFDYPDSPFNKYDINVDKTITQMINDETVSWAVHPQGVVFYFNPYVIGCYAEGIFTVEILRSERPYLFKKAEDSNASYWKEPVSFSIDLIPYLPMRLSDSPRGDRIMVSCNEAGINIEYCGETFIEEIPVKTFRPTCVQLADGRRYLLADCSVDGSDYKLRVYDLNKERPEFIKSYPMSRMASNPDSLSVQKWYTLSDPNHFYLKTTTYMDSCPVGTRLTCRIGQNGEIEVIS